MLSYSNIVILLLLVTPANSKHAHRIHTKSTGSSLPLGIKVEENPNCPVMLHSDVEDSIEKTYEKAQAVVIGIIISLIVLTVTLLVVILCCCRRTIALRDNTTYTAVQRFEPVIKLAEECSSNIYSKGPLTPRNARCPSITV
ncbi:Protein CBG14409 [Caenorhabditis briggsae]|uniref:Uncharacterized protein n=2 Tax=Caenorhabditis briggsae TaxID=6238 RepID=A0AAE8ZX74_CAEBR|nr:Protein CBG14409 [Caenorhabditis briggsae]ULT82071.1 hypothetical protein L3Y34_011793 [Caenorhabditis briggsae]CAP32953.2 Protein CBG14409 [Caenorhabditis briggsae]